MRALAPGVDGRGALGDARASASRGPTAASRSSRARARGGGVLRRRRAGRLPDRRGRRAARSCARSATSTASSMRSTPSCTARTSAARSSAASRSTTREAAAAHGARASSPSAPRRRSTGFDLLLAPTLGVRRAAAPTSSRSRYASLRPVHVPVQRARLAGARAPRRPGRGRPAGVGAARRAAGRRRAGAAPAGLRARELALWAPTFASRTSSPTRPTRSRSPVSRADLRVETKPDLTPVSEADRAAEEAIRALVAASGRGEGVLGEEFGDDGGRRALDRRSDRRDDELRPRRAGVGDAARARARGRGRCSGSSRRRRSAGAGGRCAARARSPTASACRVSAVARIEECAVSTTSARRMPDGLADDRRSAPGRTAASATSGSTASSRRAPSTSRPTANMQLWDYAAVQILVEEAGGRCTTFDGGAAAAGRRVRLDERRAARRGRGAARRAS